MAAGSTGSGAEDAVGAGAAMLGLATLPAADVEDDTEGLLQSQVLLLAAVVDAGVCGRSHSEGGVPQRASSSPCKLPQRRHRHSGHAVHGKAACTECPRARTGSAGPKGGGQTRGRHLTRGEGWPLPLLPRPLSDPGPAEPLKPPDLLGGV